MSGTSKRPVELKPPEPKSDELIVEAIRAVLDMAFDKEVQFVQIEYKLKGHKDWNQISAGGGRASFS